MTRGRWHGRAARLPDSFRHRLHTVAPHSLGLIRRLAWGLWGGLAPLAPGQYVLEIKAESHGGFWVDTTYHLEANAS